MKSDIVVISWWSNCLGLKCIHNLCQNSSDRKVFVVQTGKQEHLKDAFRKFLPQTVTELFLPPGYSNEHWSVCEWLVKSELSDKEGVWFIDHDLIIYESMNDWLNTMEYVFKEDRILFAHNVNNPAGSVTSPLFWISPKLIPKGAPDFAPVPQSTDKEVFLKPFKLFDPLTGLKIPVKDTMVIFADFLRQTNSVKAYDIYGCSPATFPKFEHPGGLPILVYSNLPDFLLKYAKSLVRNLSGIFNTCPEEWLDIEDPVLLRQIFCKNDLNL